MLQMNTRTRPSIELFAPWVEWQQETCRRGRQLITAVNHRNGIAIQVDLDNLDQAMTPGSPVNDTAQLLRSGGFLVPVGSETIADRVEPPARQPGAGLIWRGADRFVRRCHDRALHHLFCSSWVIAQVLAAAFGVIAITSVIARGGVQLHAEPGQIPATIVLGLVAVTIHELGHALVTVHYGRHVRTVGIRLHLGSPAFYVESVDALLLSRRQRIIQAAAGPWAEWLATSVALAVLVVLPSDSDAASLLHRFVIVNTIGIAINLLPFVGLDGALLLSEIVHEPDLVWRSREVLTTRSIRGGKDRWLAGYAIANAAVASALLASAVFFWWQLFGGLVAQLLASGSLGLLVVIAAAAASTSQLVFIVRPYLAGAFAVVTGLTSRIAFRLERRWRVDAINAFRTLPELNALDPAALGILAGRLQQVRTCNKQLDNQVYIYVPPRRRHIPKATDTTKAAAVVKVDPALPDQLVRYVRPTADPTPSAPMSLATTPSTTRNNVSVPSELPPARFDHRTISAANEPSRPIHTTPSVVTAMFGSGPASTLVAPRNPAAAAMKANATTSGNATSPTQ